MKIAALLVMLFLPGWLFAQTIWATHRKNGKDIVITPSKIKVVVTKDGEFFSGKIEPRENVVIVDGESIPYASIGFLEVKKLHSKSFVSGPLKFIGGTMMVLGGLATVGSLANEDEDPNLALAGAGLAFAGTGFLLHSIGKKASPTNDEKITVLHVKEWEFSFGKLLN